MSGNEHHATVDKGLKMKIKRKNVNSKSDAKHEIVKGEKMSSNESNSSNGTDKVKQNSNGAQSDKVKQSSNGAQSDKGKQGTSGDKSPKVKGSHKKEKSKEKVAKGSDVSSVSTTLDAAFSQVSLDSKPVDPTKADDPYAFCEAKDEEGIGFTLKKVKVEKTESTSFQNHIGTDTCSIGVATDPDCLGPCEPGTNVLLEGIVWQETENGVLVVNVTWRDKTYVGTLLDATKHEWAPPRFNCDSPVSDMDARTPKGRSKRGRTTNNTPVVDKILEGRTLRKGRKGSSNNTFTAPPSPAKSDISVVSVGQKRKGRPAEMDNAVNDSAKVKRSRSCSRGPTGDGSESPLPNFIECPEPNCKKKYKHMNGLRYHQSHAHTSLDNDEESRDMDNTEDSMLEDVESNAGECDTSSNNLKIDMDSLEDTECKKEDNEDSVNIDIVNVVKPTVKNSEVTKMDTDESNKKDNLITTNVTKPNIGSGHSFHAVIAGSKVHSSDVSVCSTSATVIPTQTINPTVVSVPPISSSPIQSTRPITFAAITTASQSNDHLASKTEKLIKPKVMNRPIAPSNMIALTTNVTVTHTNLAPVTTHVSSTTQFQPIQPKPTVLGDSSNVNQHLLSEFKEKKKHKRKSKDKEGSTTPSQNVNIAAAKLIKPDIKKSEPSSVIKVAPMIAKPSEPIKKEIVPIRPVELEKDKTSSMLLDKSSYPPNVGVITGQPQAKVVDLSHTPRSEASVLKVTPTLQVITSESNKSNINDDVQSPAYSDISDANEAGSPAQSASPQLIDDKNLKPKESQGAPPPGVPLENPQMNQYGGMYGNYYNPSPYLMSPAAQGSPGSNIQKMQQNPKDRSTPVDPTKVAVENKSKSDESKVDKGSETVNEKADRSQPLSQTEMQQIQHQQWVNQQMYALQSLPPQQQYHYMAAYGPYLNREYHMHQMASDPMYRQHFEKMIEEQNKRMHPEGLPKELESPRSISRSSDISVGMGPTGDMSKNKPHNLSSDGSGGSSNRDGEKRLIENDKDKVMRDKLTNEMRQQNSKDTSDKQRGDMSKDSKISDEQARRMQMYREQKSIEQQKREKKSGENRFDSRPLDLGTSKSGKSSPFQSDKPKDYAIGITIKQEPGTIKLNDSHRSDSAPDLSKSAEIRTKTPSSEKVKSVDERSMDKNDKLSNEKQRNSDSAMDKRLNVGAETPKSKLGQYSKPSSPHTPSTSLSLPVSSGSHYSPYLYHTQYGQSPPTSYGHPPFDPYRGVMYPSNNYVHPSQLGYNLGAENEKQKLNPVSKSSEMDLKKPDPSHKIHELQEKSGPGSRSASPVTGKVGDKSMVRDGSSPPTQRHVHTHHHTHVLEAAYHPVYHYPHSMYPSQTQVPQGTSIQHPPPFPPP